MILNFEFLGPNLPVYPLGLKNCGFFVLSTYNINHSVNKSYKENSEAKRTATLEKDSPYEEVITTRFCQKDNQV